MSGDFVTLTANKYHLIDKGNEYGGSNYGNYIPFNKIIKRDANFILVNNGTTYYSYNGTTWSNTGSSIANRNWYVIKWIRELHVFLAGGIS